MPTGGTHMQKASILVGLIGLIAAPCFAQAPSAAPVNLAAILGLSGEAAPQVGPLFLAGGGTGSPSNGTCTAANRSCPGERGHVACGSTTIYCSATCPICTEGSFKVVRAGCCDDDTVRLNNYQCINGAWVFQDFDCGRPCSIVP